jgi:predicted permease
MTAQLKPGWSERVYAGLLWLYPPAFRRRFGTDMRDLFRDLLHAERARDGRRGVARMWFRIIPDLAASSARERLSALRDWLNDRVVSRDTHTTAPTCGDSMLETLLHDLRYTLRTLRKTPTFAAVAILVIALGSGAVTTIFSAANAVVLRPLPAVTRPRELVDITRADAHGQGSHTPSYPFYEHVRDESRTMVGIAAWTVAQLTVSTGAEGTGALANLVSANYFDVLGVRPVLGRFFAREEDDITGEHPVIVLSHGFWQRRFGADSGIVGRTIVVNGAPYTIIGVTPPRFSGAFPVVRTDAWVPLTMAPHLGRDRNALTNAGSGWLTLFGRLKHGVSIEQARTELASIAVAHLAEEPADFRDFTGIAMSRLTGFPADASGAIRGFAALLFAVSALVLVIASVNVAGMLLARAVGRRREMAVRIALGAARGRLIRQMLTESIVLFVAGAAGGLLIAFWGARLFGRVQLPAEIPLAIDLDPDFRVLTFSLATALVTGVVFGLAPALQATRSEQVTSLRSDTAGAGARKSRLRNVLVVGQMALSLLLLTAAGLFVRALGRGQQVKPGFDTNNVVTARIDVSASGYDKARARVCYDALKVKLMAVPGVTAVSYARWVPLTNRSAGTGISVEGYTPPGDQTGRGMSDVGLGIVAPGYLDVLRMPLVRGRGFTDSDGELAPRVAVVNEAFAKQFWPGADPIGRTFRDGRSAITVVGVTRDAKYSSLNEPLGPFMFIPLAQQWNSSVNVFVRTTGDAAALAPAIREAMRGIDPQLPAPDVLTMNGATSVVLLPQRVAASVTGIMGLLGLLLAAVGLYGVVAYSVSQRTREIGVRMALGASRANVLRLIVREGMQLVIIGTVIGLLVAFGATRVLTRFLFGVSPVDPLVFAAIPLALCAVALVASYLPARRAAATDPLAALRAE